MTQDPIIEELIATVDGAVEDFNKSVPGVQRSMLNELLLLLKELDTDSAGNIKNSLANLKVIGKLKSKLEQIVLNDRYLERVADFTQTFKQVATLQNKYFQSIERTFTASKLLDEIRKQSVGSTIVSLTEAGISANVMQGIEDLLRTNITSGGTYQQLQEQLRNYILTNDTGPGVLERYTKQITTDALNQYSAQYMQTVSDDLGLEWFMYVGSNISTSRELCIHLTKKKYIHKSELPQIVKGYVDGVRVRVNKNGLPLGMIPGTNQFNFRIYRGGYNCGHQLMPVPTIVVPLHIRQRIAA